MRIGEADVADEVGALDAKHPMSQKSVAFYIASGNVDPMAFKISHFYSSHRLDKNVADEVGALDPMSHFEMPLGVNVFVKHSDIFFTAGTILNDTI